MILCFGELLFRIQPDLKNNIADIYLGGAEANVAASLATWDTPVQYLSRLPENNLGKDAVEQLNTLGIDCSKMLWGGERIGTYYLQQGKDMKSAEVIYDRKESSFATLKPNVIDWTSLLKGVTWLHCSAITPAIDMQHPAILEELLFAAKQQNITVSLDLNFRSKLWQYCKSPAQYMYPLMKYCDVVMGNMWAAESLLNVSSPVNDSKGKMQQELIDAAGISMRQVQEKWPQIQTIAYTFRLESSYFAVMLHDNEKTVSKELTLNNVIDKVGTGDSFMAGLIYGLGNKHQQQQMIDFAAAAAVSKFAVKGDFNTASQPVIQQMIST
jgi:2-dehydro-3-deoxygluconokinase